MPFYYSPKKASMAVRFMREGSPSRPFISVSESFLEEGRSCPAIMYTPSA